MTVKFPKKMSTPRTVAVAALSVIALLLGGAAAMADSSGSGLQVTVPSPQGGPTPTPTGSPSPTSPPPSSPGTAAQSTSSGVTSTTTFSSPSTGSSSGGLSGSEAEPSAAPGGAASGSSLPEKPASKARGARLDRSRRGVEAVYLPGEKVTYYANGFAPNVSVQVVMFSSPKLVGEVKSDERGQVTSTFTLDKAAPPGRHILQLTGSDNPADVAQAKFIVADPSTKAAAASTTYGVGGPSWWWVIPGLFVFLALCFGGWKLVSAMRNEQ